jgi:hypothetical protein
MIDYLDKNMCKFIKRLFMKLSGTKTTTEEISVDASNLQNELQLQISDLSEQIAELENKKPDLNTDLLSDISDSIVGQAEFLKELQSLVDLQAVKIKELESLNNSSNKIPLDTETFEAAKFEFVLGVDADGHYSDESWEEIIKKGQELQYAYYKAAEDKYSKIWPLFPGWHGSAMAPVIKIICEEPEYHFKDTKRLPGRFCLSSDRRWSSVLRFYGDGQKVLKDTIPYGTATNAPIGLYVEGKTKVQTSQGEMLMKPFEQTIEDVIVCAHNGVLPIYLSMNQDRFCIRGAKILQHQGALIGIKHGPIINETNYPFPAIQDTEGNNVYLADPRFENLQMEGPHNNKRPQAAMLLSGNNIIISNLNLYGWMQGPYMHGGQNRLINGLTQHWGNTHDGRMYCSRDEIVSYTVCYKHNTKDSDCFSGIAGNFKQWYLPKRSKVPTKGGWHNAGEHTL